jgi:hypothetical protein
MPPVTNIYLLSVQAEWFLLGIIKSLTYFNYFHSIVSKFTILISEDFSNLG